MEDFQQDPTDLLMQVYSKRALGAVVDEWIALPADAAVASERGDPLE